jgi:hypothetical protein
VRLRRLLLAGSLAALALAPAAAQAASESGVPPNRNDPCGQAGRNVCDSSGKGFYQDYRFGVRWFGDYRDLVAGQPYLYCIDLRYWYPGRQYGYRRFEATGGLRNRDGDAVSVRNQRKMAYALWNFGRTESDTQAAATMLYVHSLMGDARPGEVDPRSLGRAQVTRTFERMAADAERYHGPYRVEAKLGSDLRVGRPGTGTVRILSATGAPLPNAQITLSSTGARGVPARVRTNADGVATISFVPTEAGELRLTARSGALASTLPRYFAGTRIGSARNGQRLAAAESQTVTGSATAPVGKVRVRVTSKATPDRLLVGEQVRDVVTISGPAENWRAPVRIRLYGPFRSEGEIRCTGTPVWSEGFAGTVGETTTPAFTPAAPGIYTYVIEVPDSDSVIGTTTPCAEPSETFRVEVKPVVRTQVSAQSAAPGAQITDTVNVTGLVGETVTVKAFLYGPFASREAIKCDGAPVWTGSFTADKDGDYVTEPVTLTVPGYYTYIETIDTGGFVRGGTTPCGEVSETTVITGSPRITTQVSEQRTAPGATIADRVVVTGLGVLAAPVRVELWGPFPTREAIRCTGTPFATETFTATGDGTYTTKPVKLGAAGYYTYREFIDAAEGYAATQTECGEVSETTFARATPKVVTQVSNQVVKPGSEIFDRLTVTGLGTTTAEVQVELFGPFASDERMTCTGTPFWRGTVTARGDGGYRTAPVRVAKAGFYTYRERIAGTPVITGTEGRCGVAAETSLSIPAILTGRGDPRASNATVTATEGAQPTRVTSARLGINAPVFSVAIDLRQGILDVPAPIDRLGWWRDGAAPGASSGTVLIAGHKDSARAGAGAFFRLEQARAGDRISVRSANGTTRTYRVVSQRRMPKGDLPPDVYAQSGRARLALVTCGGPFNAREGVYRDNIVVIAVPV